MASYREYSPFGSEQGTLARADDLYISMFTIREQRERENLLANVTRECARFSGRIVSSYSYVTRNRMESNRIESRAQRREVHREHSLPPFSRPIEPRRGWSRISRRPSPGRPDRLKTGEREKELRITSRCSRSFLSPRSSVGSRASRSGFRGLAEGIERNERFDVDVRTGEMYIRV